MPQFPTHPPGAPKGVTKPAELKPAPGPEKPAPYTAYASDLCEKIVAFMDQGFSRSAFAGHIGVSHETLLAWMSEHPEFAAAGERGRAARTRFLEAQFLEGGTGAKVAAHVFALKNAAPEDWRDRPEAEGGDKAAASVVFSVPENGRSENGRLERSTHGGDDDAG